MTKNYAIIFGSGIGSRFGAETPKQFNIIAGKTIFYHTYEVFNNSGMIDGILCVCLKDYIDTLRNEIKDQSKLIDIIPGSTSALRSIECGINFLKANEYSGYVAIHDAVRPLLSQKDLEENLKIAQAYGNCIEYVNVIETIAIDGIIQQRDKCRNLRAPQTFQICDIARVFDSAKNIDLLRDCAELTQKQGIQLNYHQTSTSNIKVTNREDFYLVENLLEYEHNRKGNTNL